MGEDAAVFVVMQLSDLHRSSADPVGNAELVAALESDRGRWPPALANGPDLIVVSGDLVQGVDLGTVDSDAKLDAQYADANEFLDELVGRFLQSDRSRLLLVPGNHDIDWCTARASMSVVDADELARVERVLPWIALDPGSPYRWSWRDRQLLRVVDHAVYKARLRRFLDFRTAFYADVTPDPLRFGQDLVYMEHQGLDVSLTGLSSWHGNDCYCHVGAFDPDLLAAARDAIAASTCSLHVAVWHHSTAGPPADSDFLDVRQVHRLIDYGFRVGLHGHHHRTDAAVMTLRLPTSEEFALVSAGSLAAGRRELPAGVHRQYTLIEVDPLTRRLRVHVREAISDLIFAASARTELGGNSYVDLSWSETPPSPARTAAITSAIDEGYAAFALGDFDRALQVLAGVPVQAGAAKKLRVEVLVALEKWDDVVALIADPATPEELIVLIDAHCHLGSPQRAREALEVHSSRVQLGSDIRGQLDARISVKESAL